MLKHMKKTEYKCLRHTVQCDQLSGILICATSDGGLSVQTISLVFPKYTWNMQ